MTLSLRGLMIVCGLAGLWMAALLIPAEAQTTMLVEPFTVDGGRYAIEYPSDTPASTVAMVRRAVTYIMPSLSTMIGVPPMNVAVVLEPRVSDNPSLLAAARPRNAGETYDCYVFVFPVPANRVAAVLRFTLAHEIVHCFQFAINTSSIRAVKTLKTTDRDPNLWWVEGTAEWFASRLYPPIGSPIAANIRDFYIINNQTLYDKDYENFWFFQFLAQHRGERAVLNLMRDIPNTLDGHTRYLEGIEATPELFAAFARLTQRHALRHQPAFPPRRDVPTYTVGALPGTQLLSREPLTLGVLRVDVPRVAEGRGLKVEMTRGYGSGYRVLLPDGQSVTPDGQTLCEDAVQTSLLLMVARGASASPDDEGEVRFSEAECAPTACYEGVWNAGMRQRVGADTYTYFELEPTRLDEIEFVLGAEGSITGHVVGIQPLPNGFVSTNTPAPISGSFVVNRVVKSAYGSVYVAITTTAPIRGTANGSGGTFDAQQIWTFYDSGRSATIVFPAYHTLQCGNPVTLPDGSTRYDYLAFYEGDIEAVMALEAYPAVETFRAGTLP
jgi:hypothetical protein